MTPRSARPGDVSTPPGGGQPTTFDVREFARTARGGHRSDPALTALEGVRLGSDAVHLLRTLRDLERTTLDRMRNLLVTATHKDARVTAFLTTWAFEKFWVADALDAALVAAGEATEGPNAGGRLRRSFSERAERRGPVARAVAANFAGAQIVAAHVTTGLVDEWITQTAYRRLASVAGALGGVADLVTGIKDRHIHFLEEEAHRRLAASRRARALTRRAIRQAVWPVGAVGRPAADRSFFETIVFGGADGASDARGIADRVSGLPGLAPVGNLVAARLVP